VWNETVRVAFVAVETATLKTSHQHHALRIGSALRFHHLYQR